MKTCTKCGKEYSATSEFFSPDKRTNEGLQSWCKECHRKISRGHHQNHIEEHKVSRRGYQATISGRICRIISHIGQRCCNPNYKAYLRYGGRGIKLEFTNKELTGWLSENNIDPRGLDIHRKDNGGNYSLDNIEFLTASEHTKLHKNHANRRKRHARI